MLDEVIYVDQHFDLPDHSLEDLDIFPIEQPPIFDSKEETESYLDEREAFWICELQTFWPFGFNTNKGAGQKRKILPVTLLYNRRNIQLGKIFKDEFKILQSNLQNPIQGRLIIAYRKNPNLRNLLVSSTLLPVVDE